MGSPSVSSECSNMCEECGKNVFKYKCPGCGVRSCGLECVKAHKTRTNCSGKRNRTAFVPISEFDDNVLISDYNLLEEILRQTDSARRLRVPFGGDKQEMHPAMKALQHQAKMRDIKLLFLAHGMSKRKSNSTYFDRKRKCIFWRVEWVFEGTNIRLVNARVDENSSLKSVLEKHFAVRSDNTATLHQLCNFHRQPISNLKLFLQKEPSESSKKAFYELDVEGDLGAQLSQKCLIEYPVIHVALNSDPEKFPVVVNLKSITSNASQPPPDVKLETPIIQEAVGVPFREEEIEEGEFVP
ncbi:hypothetical protein CY35_12G093800 [Sphagnum magellanicum]|nr:hypothetical protein CY35_12G093800 [Sphagnum magellanicum]KAH9546412.1 hypothetical protein CY35_12G093800 [Sphagnum magellanicum]